MWLPSGYPPSPRSRINATGDSIVKNMRKKRAIWHIIQERPLRWRRWMFDTAGRKKNTRKHILIRHWSSHWKGHKENIAITGKNCLFFKSCYSCNQERSFSNPSSPTGICQLDSFPYIRPWNPLLIPATYVWKWILPQTYHQTGEGHELMNEWNRSFYHRHQQGQGLCYRCHGD